MKNGKGNPPITDESFWSSSTCCFPEAPFLQILYPGMDRMWPLVVPCLMQVLQDCSIHCLRVLLHLKYANPPKVSTLSADADKPVHDSSE